MRCMLIITNFQKRLWTSAVYTSVYIRNHALNRRLWVTPFEAVTGKKPNLSEMQIFGTSCFEYIQNQPKLEPCCEKGVFVSYGKSCISVYFNSKNQIKRVRGVKFCDNVVQKTGACTREPVQNVDQNIVEPCISDNTLVDQA